MMMESSSTGMCAGEKCKLKILAKRAYGDQISLPVILEPRGGQDDFEHVLKDYDTIRQGNKPMTGKRRGKKWDANTCNVTKSKASSKGPMLLAVCRGKVSEGIDFSDDNARTVIIVEIPFPNVFDIQVAEKKKYNDTYKSSKSLLSGSEWYCQQAFRALNQAAVRCMSCISDPEKGGIKDENIVVFMYDDIANNEENPRPGVIINHPDVMMYAMECQRLTVRLTHSTNANCILIHLPPLHLIGMNLNESKALKESAV